MFRQQNANVLPLAELYYFGNYPDFEKSQQMKTYRRTTNTELWMIVFCIITMTTIK